ncbi:tyrosine-type recombinase/integrase [Clostridia bacterium OttesenSCG-928-F22]|nr:tyrosine-type recombinase/integrase [Clostridia bacterium OttesenSCG-928-F22]
MKEPSKEKTYKEQSDTNNILKLRQVLKELPSFCAAFFRGIENTTSTLTRLNYAYDIRTFFQYLCLENSKFDGCTPRSITIEQIDALEALDIELFMEYLNFYYKEDKELTNHERGKARKISTLRSFFKYLFRHGYISANVATLIDMPKLHERPIIRLEPDEVARLLDSVESGNGLTDTQKRYHKYTRLRDTALLTLFLGTGIRISELVGLNIGDIDFNNNSFKITRKGGNQTILYFGSEIQSALEDYLIERTNIAAQTGHEQALFLSLQNKRLSTRSIQQLVKKYTQHITLKSISPHKLRSTYGTILYQETGDIYLVADVLGHKDVNTTKKHYAAVSDEKRRLAANTVRLRED